MESRETWGKRGESASQVPQVPTDGCGTAGTGAREREGVASWGADRPARQCSLTVHGYPTPNHRPPTLLPALQLWDRAPGGAAAQVTVPSPPPASVPHAGPRGPGLPPAVPPAAPARTSEHQRPAPRFQGPSQAITLQSAHCLDGSRSPHDEIPSHCRHKVAL